MCTRATAGGRSARSSRPSATTGTTAITGWALNYVDELVTFEGSAAQYTAYEPSSWVLGAKPEEIANMVVFLASAHARYVTGTTIAMDGGLNPVVV